MAELNDAVATAVARCRELEKLCTSPQHRHQLSPDTHCPECHGNIGVPAIVTALIEAVTRPCSVPYVPADGEHWSNCACAGTGRTPRDWEEIGEGALAGVLGCEIDGLLSDDAEHIWDEAASAAREFDDLATLTAVDKALEQMFGGEP